MDCHPNMRMINRCKRMNKLPHTTRPIALAAILAATTALSAADWPQYRGVDHDGKSPERIVPWTGTSPNVVWKTATPKGFSSFVVSDGRAFTLIGETIEGVDREVCIALDADTGQRIWSHPIGIARYDGGGDSGARDNRGGDGPRTTPSIDGDAVYVLSAQLYLACLDAATGEERWSVDILRQHEGRNITWQNGASPLIDGDHVYVAGGGPGQALLAFHKDDGRLIWKAEDDRMTHATPVATTIHDVRQIIFFTQPGLVSLQADTGAVLWRYPFRFNVATAASPVVAGDVVYCSAGYEVGAAAVRISRTGDSFNATEIWRITGNRPLANHWSTPVYHDGHLYGMFSFREYGNGPLKCVELATGTVKWERAGFGPGNVILAGNHLLALADDGDLAILHPTPIAYTELARANILDGKCWSTPIVSGGRIYARSTTEAVCIDVNPQQAAR
jgi:outer membrane protein assembly factor BamB